MARSRIIKPGFFTNEMLAELSFEARLCFAGLWTLADREGRLEDRPKRIAAALFPYDTVDIHAILASLTDSGFIDRYRAGEVAVISLPTFFDHQHPHPRELASILPCREQALPGHEKVLPEPGLAGTGPSVSVSVSDPVSISVSTHTEPAAAKPELVPAKQRPAVLFSGKDHRAHVACGRVCVPEFLHRRFIAALGGPEDMADGRLRDWYTGVENALDPDLPVEADPTKFWPPRFQSLFVTPGTPAAFGKQTQRLAAAIANINAEAS